MSIKKNTFFIRDNFYERVEERLSNKKYSRELQNHIAKFIDKNSDVLFDNAPRKRLFFRDNDYDIIFEITQIKRKEIEEVIKRNKILMGNNWFFSTKPFNWLSPLILKYYYENDMKEEFKSMLTYLTLSIYAQIHYKYFQFVPNDNIMDYTINEISNQYFIKKYSSLFKSIYVTAENSHDTYKDQLKRASDYDLITYSININTRINSMIKNVARAYYKNSEEKNYMNYDKESRDEEDYYEVDNVSFFIEKFANNASNILVSYGTNIKIANLSASITNVSRKGIRTAINNIMENETKNINLLIKLILQQYLVEENNDREQLGSKDFIYVSKKVYSKSNTNDENVLKIKEILDTWLEDNSEKYVKTERKATKSNFRKAIYFYFVFSIQEIYTKNL